MQETERLRLGESLWIPTTLVMAFSLFSDEEEGPGYTSQHCGEELLLLGHYPK